MIPSICIVYEYSYFKIGLLILQSIHRTALSSTWDEDTEFEDDFDDDLSDFEN